VRSAARGDYKPGPRAASRSGAPRAATTRRAVSGGTEAGGADPRAESKAVGRRRRSTGGGGGRRAEAQIHAIGRRRGAACADPRGSRGRRPSAHKSPPTADASSKYQGQVVTSFLIHLLLSQFVN